MTITSQNPKQADTLVKDFLILIQCDIEVQESRKITNAQKFDQNIRSMTLSGFRGTDFRPVFAYSDQLFAEIEFKIQRGLIHFADGFGTYLTRKQNFDTTIVLLDESYAENF